MTKTESEASIYAEIPDDESEKSITTKNSLLRPLPSLPRHYERQPGMVSCKPPTSLPPAHMTSAGTLYDQPRNTAASTNDQPSHHSLFALTSYDHPHPHRETQVPQDGEDMYLYPLTSVCGKDRDSIYINSGSHTSAWNSDTDYVPMDGKCTTSGDTCINNAPVQNTKTSQNMQNEHDYLKLLPDNDVEPSKPPSTCSGHTNHGNIYH